MMWTRLNGVDQVKWSGPAWASLHGLNHPGSEWTECPECPERPEQLGLMQSMP